MLGFIDTAYNLQVDLGLEDEQVGDVSGGEAHGEMDRHTRLDRASVTACRYVFWQKVAS